MQASTTQQEFQVSDDGYWQLVDGNWVPTELQNEAIAKGANPHVSNIGVNTTSPAHALDIIESANAFAARASVSACSAAVLAASAAVLAVPADRDWR